MNLVDKVNIFQTQNRSEVNKLIQLYASRESFFATWALQNDEKSNKLSSMNMKLEEIATKSVEKCKGLLKEVVQRPYRHYNKELEKVKSYFKSRNEDQIWRHQMELRWARQERDILKNREKRRSEQRREKRLRKKQRQAEAKGSNHTVVEENEADEE